VTGASAPRKRKVRSGWKCGSSTLRFRGGLVFKAHRWLYHSTLGSRVIKKKNTALPRGCQNEFENNQCAVVTEAGSCLRCVDSCITQLKAQGPSRTCNESNEEEEERDCALTKVSAARRSRIFLCTLVAGPKRSLSLKLSDARVYEPQIRALPVPQHISVKWLFLN